MSKNNFEKMVAGAVAGVAGAVVAAILLAGCESGESASAKYDAKSGANSNLSANAAQNHAAKTGANSATNSNLKSGANGLPRGSQGAWLDTQPSAAARNDGANSNLSANAAQNPAQNTAQNPATAPHDLAKYREIYAKPTSEWPKPRLDSSVEPEWEEFAPLPRRAPAPADNEFTGIKAFLGRTLFNEPRLSKSGQFACENCHHKELASTDALPQSWGHGGQIGRRNAPSTQLAGFFDELFWDGRARGLEEQALGPITDPVEMANTLEAAAEAIRGAAEYYPLFVAAFGGDELRAAWGEFYAWVAPKRADGAKSGAGAGGASAGGGGAGAGASANSNLTLNANAAKNAAAGESWAGELHAAHSAQNTTKTGANSNLSGAGANSGANAAHSAHNSHNNGEHVIMELSANSNLGGAIGADGANSGANQNGAGAGANAANQNGATSGAKNVLAATISSGADHIAATANAAAADKPDPLGLRDFDNLDPATIDAFDELEYELFGGSGFRRLLNGTLAGANAAAQSPNSNLSGAGANTTADRANANATADRANANAGASAKPTIPEPLIHAAQELITPQNIAKAIATFERGPGLMKALNTRFGRFLRGDYAALTDRELWGLDLFRNKARCANCHYGFLLSDKKFHNLGLGFYGRAGQDLGRFEVTRAAADIGAFKTPSLVNVARSAPYMHNGLVPSLKAVVALFNSGVNVPQVSDGELQGMVAAAGARGGAGAENGVANSNLAGVPGGDNGAANSNLAGANAGTNSPNSNLAGAVGANVNVVGDKSRAVKQKALVVDERGELVKPVKSPLIAPLNLTADEMDALEAFLRTL